MRGRNADERRDDTVKTFVKENRTTYRSMNQVLQTPKISSRQISFCDKDSEAGDDIDFVFFVLFKLMKLGCKSFIKNLAVRPCPAKGKKAIHCDLIGYQRKNDTLFVLSYARKKSRLKKTWLHSRNFKKAVTEVLSPETTIKSIVVPFYTFRNSRRVSFRHKDPFLETDSGKRVERYALCYIRFGSRSANVRLTRMPHGKNGIKLILRNLNIFRQQLREQNIPSLLSQYVKSGRSDLSFFCDIDHSVTFLKRLVRRALKRRRVDASMQINYYHIEYFLQTIFGVILFCRELCAMQDHFADYTRLRIMAKKDYKDMDSFRPQVKPCLVNSWGRCRTQLQALFFNMNDSVFTFHTESMALYCQTVLNEGHFVMPKLHSYHSRLMQREVTGAREHSVQRVSPTLKKTPHSPRNLGQS